jgi:hypothetical protein
MLNLACGDPEREYTGVSYSRFVLPFAYAPEPIAGGAQASAFIPADPINRDGRLAYLTEETARVLFRRAHWLKLENPSHTWPQRVRLQFRDGFHWAVGISAPWLVLFEWPENGRRAYDADVLQTGFLMVEVHFAKDGGDPVDPGRGPILDDLLELNELFRYWRRPFPKHPEKGYKRLLGNLRIALAGDAELTIADCTRADWIYTGRWSSLLDVAVRIDGETWRLVRAGAGARSQPDDWEVYSDNRAFVWSCASVPGGGHGLERAFGGSSLEPWLFGHWVKLMNVDEPVKTGRDGHGCTEALERRTHENTSFEQEWARERTYRRWVHEGTYYGFTYHSGALLARPDHDLPVWHHFGQMYFDQVLLLFYLRVTLFRFSRELTGFSERMRDCRQTGEEIEPWQEEFQLLRQAFTIFTNLYQFPLISNQQQAIEMYALAREHMDVNGLYGEIQDEIHHTHDYLAAQTSLGLAHTTTRLTVVATLGLVLALAAGFLGMNILAIDATEKTVTIVHPWLFGLSLVVSILLILTVTKFSSLLARHLRRLADKGRSHASESHRAE